MFTKPSLTSTLRAILAQVRGLQYVNKMASSKVEQEVSYSQTDILILRETINEFSLKTSLYLELQRSNKVMGGRKRLIWKLFFA